MDRDELRRRARVIGAFMSALRTDVLELLEECERLKAENAQLRAACEEYARTIRLWRSQPGVSSD